MRIALRRPAGLLGLVALLAAVPARAGAPAEKCVPGTTFGFVKIENAAALRQAFQASQLGQLVADPAVKPLKDEILEKLKEPSEKLRARIGLSLGELLSLPQGEISLALIATDGAAHPVAIVVTADAGENQAKMGELLDKLTQMAKDEAETKVTTEEFAGSTLHILTPTKEDEKDNPPLVWTKKGSTFYAGSSVEAVKDVLAKADGRDDSLAANASYKAVQAKVGGDGQILWFLDVEQALKLIVKAVGEQNNNAAQIEAQLQLTGINGLKAIGGRAGVNVGGYDQLSRAFLYAPGESQGLLRLFVMPQTELRPQPWVPASIASYQSVSWDLDAAYKAIVDLVDTVAPGVLAGIEQQLAGPKGDGLNFEKDIFGPLGDRITVLSDLKPGTAATTAEGVPVPNQRLLFGVALEDSKAFQNTINKVIELVNASPKKREFQGTTIYDFDLPELPNAEATGIQGPVSLAVAKDTLFIATDPTLLEQVLRGGPGLADSPGYRTVAAKLPAKSSSQSYQKAEQQARAVFDMLKSEQFQKALQQQAREDGNDDVDLTPIFKKLPDFSVVAKYLSDTGGFSQMEPDGITFTQFSLKKAQP
jgi:hypothetical protein